MSGNANFSFDDIAVVAVAACDAPNVVTSAEFDDQLTEFYHRVGARPGLLESLAGITERRQWPEEVSFMDAAAMAGERALNESGVDRSRIGLIVDTSVCRERLEPSSSVTVHDALGLPSTCMNFDVSNACLGFLNGMHLAGAMIESGQIEYALIVDGEGTREIQNNTINRLLAPEATMDDLFSNFASLTLGSGSTAMVVGRHSSNPGSHRIVRGFFRADTVHHDLCVGSLQSMRTDTAALLEAGTSLAKLAWDDAEKADWNNMDRYILHQVSQVHTSAMIDVLGIDGDKVPMSFPTHGNMGPAALPFTLAGVQDTLSAGDRVLCLGIGSGLNCAVVELLW
ncbi:MAG: 3-oxoacyl-[acyl-carrier-protein] synthase III [Candidatus Poriferisodalaceae bacterium]|jgi:3-oxoacyl-[acyl-carrier-protein] synthase III